MGIPLSYMNKALVEWKYLVASGDYKNAQEPLVVPLGMTAEGESVIVDVYSIRHLLVCGIADSGKTMLMHSIVNSLIARNTPEKLRLIICDPKHVEYQSYEALSHLLTPVITDAKKTVLALKWIVKESERRLNVLRQAKARNIAEYHEIAAGVTDPEERAEYEAMPYIVVVIDDYSILSATYPRELTANISALLPNAKATGIHLIMTTSRFDSHTVPVSLREQFSARLVFHIPAAQSRLLVGDSSAESLTERGAALYRPSGMKKAIMLQTGYISEDEIDAHVETMTRKYPAEQIDPSLVPAEQYWGKKKHSIFVENPEDDKYEEAVEAVREAGKASTSYLQRKLGIGYSRAAHLIDLLEQHGIIGPGDGAKPRDVIDWE